MNVEKHSKSSASIRWGRGDLRISAPMARSGKVEGIRRRWAIGALIGLLAAVSFHGIRAEASERRFTYTYGSDVLNAGAVEFEPWTTFRVDRDGFYNRMDHRLEFEVGLTDRLQTAWYFNFKAISQDEGMERVTEFEWDGVSWEWKLKVLDPVADPIGLGLYFEPGIAPGEAEIEAKLILDKRIGDVYTAFNAVFEHEWEFEEQGETEREIVGEFDLGVTYFMTPALSLGIEVRNHNEFPAGEGFEHSALFAGPAVSYATSDWWATLTVLPQLPALK
ncbi:MAG: hypothetical protein D6812_13175, partial [Deltaproteobacteria bacterium]